MFDIDSLQLGHPAIALCGGSSRIDLTLANLWPIRYAVEHRKAWSVAFCLVTFCASVVLERHEGGEVGAISREPTRNSATCFAPAKMR